MRRPGARRQSFPPSDTPEGERLDVLVTLVEAHERKHYATDLPDAVEVNGFAMERRGLSVKHLVPTIGALERIDEVLNRKRPLSLKMIWRLHKNLAIPAESVERPMEESVAV